ncbi:MAG: Wzz/FepE/Etk N-terminal domain-containing protein [Pseudomonadota bacterium]
MNDNYKSGVASDSEIDMVSMLAVLWRYKWLVAGVALASALIAVWLAMTTPFVYRADVTITPVSSGDNGMGALGGRLGSLAGLAGVSLPSGGPTQESLAVLRSRHLTEIFLARYKLQDRILGNAAKQSLWLAVDRFRQVVLSFRQEKESGTTIVSMQWKDPAEAAKWANAYVALANEILRNRAIEDSTRNIKFLNEQISKTSVIEIQKVMFGLVENETKNHMLASTREEYAFTVVDPAATPESRVWPRRGVMVLTGLGLGIGFGAFLALGLNFWRRHRKALAT